MKPVIFTLTGPSCAGKTTLERMMVERLGFANIISTTTRKMRDGEVDGVGYYFVDRSEFARLKEQGAFIEAVTFNGNSYGVSKAEVQRVTEQGKSIIVVVEPDGREQIKAWAEIAGAQCISIFIDGDTEMIADRFLNRFVQDYEAKRKVSIGAVADFLTGQAIRLGGMLSVERDWHMESKKEFDNPYVMNIAEFNEETEDEILGQIAAVNQSQRVWFGSSEKTPA